MNLNRARVLQAEVEVAHRIHGQPQRLETLALTLFVAVTVLVSATVVIARIGSLYVGGISMMVRP